MNDPLVHEAAAAWSERLEVTASEDSERLRLAWRQALQRWPEAEELSEALEFMQDYGVRFAESDGRRKSLEAVLRSLLGSNEFLHVD
jgi:3'-phosphoadenosine 5'-phosphosulfate sulfotransferase